MIKSEKDAIRSIVRLDGFKKKYEKTKKPYPWFHLIVAKFTAIYATSIFMANHHQENMAKNV